MFKKVIIIGICMVAVIGMVKCVDAAYSDDSDVSSERPDDIFNSRNKSSYETKLGLAPEKNSLGPASDDIENYKLEQSIIDIKKEKKKIVTQKKTAALERAQLEKTQIEQLQREMDVVKTKAVARQEKERGQKTKIIIQGMFIFLVLGVLWFIRKRIAND